MNRKPISHRQSRLGCPERRQFEFDCVVDQVKRRKQQFIERLERNIRHLPNGCIEYWGALDHKGYPRISFRLNGEHTKVLAHRVFMIMMTCKPIPLGMEVDHECKNRRCVKHLRLKHYTENAADVKKAEPCPF